MDLTVEQALKQGVASHEEGKLQEAEQFYRAILQVLPEHPDANHNLGVLLVSINKTQAALPLFKDAVETHPGVNQFWLSYIDALIKEGQFEIANNALEESEKQGLIGEELDILRQAINSATTDLSPPQSELNCLLEYYQNGQYEEAEQLARSINQAFPNHQFSWKVLGAILGQTGRISEALAAIQKEVALAPKDPEAHSNLGVTLQALGKLEEAEASCRNAIALAPNFAEAYYNLGNTLKEMAKLEEAAKCFSKAIALTSEYAEAQSNLGVTLHELGRLEEAEASCRKAIAISPEYAEAHYNLSITLQKRARFKEAEEGYKQAIALNPNFPEAHFNFGNMLLDLGQLDEASESYQKAAQLKNHFGEAIAGLGTVLMKKGQHKKGIKKIREGNGSIFFDVDNGLRIE